MQVQPPQQQPQHWWHQAWATLTGGTGMPAGSEHWATARACRAGACSASGMASQPHRPRSKSGAPPLLKPELRPGTCSWQAAQVGHGAAGAGNHGGRRLGAGRVHLCHQRPRGQLLAAGGPCPPAREGQLPALHPRPTLRLRCGGMLRLLHLGFKWHPAHPLASSPSCPNPASVFAQAVFLGPPAPLMQVVELEEAMASLGQSLGETAGTLGTVQGALQKIVDTVQRIPVIGGLIGGRGYRIARANGSLACSSALQAVLPRRKPRPMSPPTLFQVQACRCASCTMLQAR